MKKDYWQVSNFIQKEATDINPLFNRDYSKDRVMEETSCDKIHKQLSNFNGIKYVVIVLMGFNDCNDLTFG